MEFDPEARDYHQAIPHDQPPPVETRDAAEEAIERENNRRRTTSPARRGDGHANLAVRAANGEPILEEMAKAKCQEKKEEFEELGIDEAMFLFGVERNIFDDRYEAMAEEDYSGGGARRSRASSPTRRIR